jgi:hypothetical protein
MSLDKITHKETAMIELTQEQRKSLQDGEAVRVREKDQEYVLLRPDVYDRLSQREYDNDSWTAAEMDLLREESVTLLDRFGKHP